MWTFISRQWLTSVITTMWSSEHAAWSFLITLYLFEVVRKPGGAIPGFGIWYLALAWITWVGAVVSLKQNLIVMLTLTTGAFGATILGIDDMFGLNMFIFPGSILLIIAGILAWYAASALLLQSTFRKQILPVWPSKLKSGQGGGKTGRGEPGVKQSL
jgi:succinate-acetate transporter protein